MALLSLPRILRQAPWLLVTLLLAGLTPTLSAQTSVPSANDGFDPNVTGIVYSVALQTDGKMLVGGSFTALAPNGATQPTSRGNLARINTDGSLDTTFDPEPNGQVSVITLQADGQILIGGSFTSLNPGGKGIVNRNHIARLKTDGSLDTTFDPNATGTFASTGQVLSIALQSNNQIIIGGAFISVGGAAHNHIARLGVDGSVDATFKTNLNAQVDAICVQPNDGKILIGGAFTGTLFPGTVPSGSYNGNHMARLNTDGTVDTSFDPDVNNQVTGIAIDATGEIVIVGYFDLIQATASTPTTADFIARLNPDGTPDGTNSTDPSWLNPALSAGIQSVAIQPDGKIVVGGNLGTVTNSGGSTFVSSFLARLNPDGSSDTSFLPGPNYLVNTVVIQPDGKIVAGGQFSQFKNASALSGTSRNGIARVNGDGTLDLTFDPNTFGGIGVFVTQPNGQILIGGSFASVGGLTRTNLARLNANGTVDAAFNPGPNGAITAITLLPNGQMLIGGHFSSVDPGATSNPLAVSFLARLNADGTLDTSFNPEVNAAVSAMLLQPNGQILVAGNFSQFTPNGSPITTVAATNALAAAIAAGTVTSTVTVTPVVVEFVARLNSDGTVDTNFEPNPNAQVDCMLLDPSGKYVILGGGFNGVTPAADGIPSTSNFVARVGLDNGELDTLFNPNPNAEVRTMAFQANGQLLLGGSFSGLTPNPVTTTTIVGTTVTTTTTPLTVRPGIARVNADGTLDTNFAPAADSVVLSVAVNPTNGQILVGGAFDSISGQSRLHAARLNSDGSVDAGFNAKFNGIVDSVQFGANNQMLISGSFTNVLLASSASPAPIARIARFNGDGSLDSTFQPNLQANSQISAIALQDDGKLILGGSFVNAVGAYATNCMRLNTDTTQDGTFAPNTNGPVYALATQADTSCYIGGSFTVIGGGNSNNFARVNSDGSLDTLFPVSVDGQVNAVAIEPIGLPIIGGNFSNVNGVAQRGVARFNLNGTLDTAFRPSVNGNVTAVAVQQNGQILIGGSFTTVGGTTRSGLARLSAAGALDTAFAPAVNGAVNAVVVQPNGQILIGGSFTTVAGAARNRVARLNADGSVDTNFNPNANNTVNALLLQTDGAVIMGGAFTNVGGTTVNFLARVSATGVVDAAFNPAPDAAVNVVAMQADGKPVIAGSFANVGGQPRPGFARLATPGFTAQAIVLGSDKNTLSWFRSGPGPEAAAVLFQWSTDYATWTTMGYATYTNLATSHAATAAPTSVPNATSVWTITGFNKVPSNLSGQGLTNLTNVFVRALAVSPTSIGSGSSLIQSTMQQFEVTPSTSTTSGVPPAGTTVPTSAALAPTFISATQVATSVGSAFYYAVAAENGPTTYSASGLPAGLFLAGQGSISGTPTQPGSYVATVTIANSVGSVIVPITINVAAASASPAPSVLPAARLINLSTRANVTASNPLSDGFIIAGPAAKSVLLRAVGPALSSMGVASALAAPKLQLFDKAGNLILTNSGWGSNSMLSQISSQVGAFPLAIGSADAAVVTTLAPGSYTLTVTPASGSGGTALAEIYDADVNSQSLLQRLVNISGSASVDAADPIVGGFVISGPTAKTVLVRAVGPALSGFGISSALNSPTLSLFDSTNTLIAKNSGWGTQTTANAAYPATTSAAVAQAAVNAGAFALGSGSADSAILVNLPPGVYTGQVTGASGQSGVALFEVYEIPGN